MLLLPGVLARPDLQQAATVVALAAVPQQRCKVAGWTTSFYMKT